VPRFRSPDSALTAAELDIDLPDRLPGPVEAAAYYQVSEALTNVAKYAGAGGAHADGGSGLRGLADRVEALNGRVTIDSPLGAGTTLRADIPLTG